MGDIEEILRGLETLRASDPGFRLFGAQSHRYTLGPPTSESDLSEFESRFGVPLPPDYRAFLREIGNGGAGPGYGICKLGAEDTGDGMVPWDARQDPSRPFPHTRPWSGRGYLDEPRPEDYEGDDETFRAHHRQWSERDREWWAAYLDGAGIHYGTIPLCHLGCGQTALLVVNGPSAGEVWNNLLSDEMGVGPALHDGRRLSFAAWYLCWLRASLQAVRG